ncbi:integrase family protein (plasmid) [Oscillatoria nigro-viridis PCC 7112]|uniref:Integrase family protein n=1 Tax=Phormidium nigroviride PCC 7112 TaxID=179408 RepID=K9VSF8_9CYAN|nr:tyrosine-type recombinase/integrase [Oscillatoria nigro-viridis]AFZ10876.1 integrase family protein [Oscillatoria nigro-viridis PCC 7112]
MLANPSSLNSLVTVSSLLETWTEFLALDVAAGDAAQDTADTYRRQLRLFLSWCDCASPQINPTSATKEDIKRYRRFLVDDRSLKPATVALKLSVVRRFYDAAVEKGLILTNPALSIKPPREKRDAAEKVTYLEKSEVEKLLAAIKSDGSVKALRDKALLAIMALEGPRTVEMHRANIADLVQQGNNLGIRVEGKGSIRIVPLTPEIALALMNYLEARKAMEVLAPSSPLFVAVGYRAGGQRISRRGIRKVVDGYLKEAGLKHSPGRTISTHSLRHTAGTLALRAGAELRQVQDLLGHKDPRTTSIYTHVAERWANNPALKLGITIGQ